MQKRVLSLADNPTAYDMAATEHQEIEMQQYNGVGDEEKGLHRTTTGVTMSPELFEKVNLNLFIHGIHIAYDLVLALPLY